MSYFLMKKIPFVENDILSYLEIVKLLEIDIKITDQNYTIFNKIMYTQGDNILHYYINLLR